MENKTNWKNIALELFEALRKAIFWDCELCEKYTENSGIKCTWDGGSDKCEDIKDDFLESTLRDIYSKYNITKEDLKNK